MKKVLQILSAIVVSAGLMGSVANAEGCMGTIVIHNSGDGNVTTIECEDIENVTITCENNVTVANISYQESQSGPATVGGNGSNGSSNTGSVTNTNNQTTQIGVTGCGGSTTPETPVTPGGGGNGGGVAGGVTPTAAPKQAVAALPFTASNDIGTIAAASIAGAAIVLALSRLGVAAYRRVNK